MYCTECGSQNVEGAAFCTGCGRPLGSAQPSQPSQPVSLTVEFPEQLSRGLLLLKVFLGWIYVGIPHGICLAVYGLATYVVVFLSFFAILFTGRYPRGFFDFAVGYLRWGTRVTAYWELLLRDEYPPFSAREDDSGVSVRIQYPDRLSRGLLLLKVFFGWLILLPHMIVLYLYEIVVAVVVFLVFFVILITGKYPRGLFDFVVGYARWTLRVNAYWPLLLRDEYPPFSTE